MSEPLEIRSGLRQQPFLEMSRRRRQLQVDLRQGLAEPQSTPPPVRAWYWQDRSHEALA